MSRLKAVSVVFASLSWLLAAGERSTAQSRPSEVSDEFERAFAQATRLHQSGDIEGAIRGYQAILKKHPRRVDVRSNLGAALVRLGRYEDAITQYKQALTMANRNQTIRFNLALAYYKANWVPEAASELSAFVNAVAESEPQRLPALLLLADCWVRLGEYKQVIGLLTPLQTAYGNDRTLAYLLGSALISDNEVAQGQAIIDRVFRDEDSAEAHLLVGSILLVADDGPGALKELERALALNSQLPALQAGYGRALMRMGDGEKAMSAFRTELERDPNNFDAHLYLGILLRREKSFDEATDHLTRALRLRPRDAYARYHLGALYASLGKPAEALPLLESVVKEFSDFVEAHALLASVYYRLNRKADGDRERALIQMLTAEEQAKQPGVANKKP